jgi:hypothetical protein
LVRLGNPGRVLREIDVAASERPMQDVGKHISAVNVGSIASKETKDCVSPCTSPLDGVRRILLATTDSHVSIWLWYDIIPRPHAQPHGLRNESRSGAGHGAQAEALAHQMNCGMRYDSKRQSKGGLTEGIRPSTTLLSGKRHKSTCTCGQVGKDLTCQRTPKSPSASLQGMMPRFLYCVAR